MDISFCSFSKTPSGAIVKFAGANNSLGVVRERAKNAFGIRNARLIKGDDFELYEIKGDSQPMGLYDHMKPFTQFQLELENDDLIYLSSEGYTDQFGGPNGKKLKQKNLKKILLQFASMDMKAQLFMLDNQFQDWKGEEEQLDDVCVIGVRV